MNKIIFKNFYLILLLFFANIFCAYAENLRVAAGFSTTNLQNFYPLLLVNKGEATYWQTIKKIAGLPENFRDARLGKVVCINDRCIVLGFYLTNDFYDFIATSEDGETWEKMPINHSAQHYSGLLRDLDCADSSCLAIGEHNNNQPYIVRSSDKGQTWSAINDINGVPVNVTLSVAAVAFSKNAALIAGFYYEGLTMRLLMLRSIDHGKSWHNLTNIGDLPDRLVKLHPSLASLSCVDQHCVAVGDFMEERDGTTLIMSSKNDGASWQLVKHIKNYPTNMNTAYLFSVSCSKNNCVAVGRYSTTQQQSNLPLILTSENKGETWSFVNSIAGLPNNFVNANLYQVNCNNQRCVATGMDNFLSAPLIIASNDAGKSWRYIDRADNLLFADTVHINNSFCTQKKCYAVGSYKQNQSANAPLILSSTPDLKSWHKEPTEELKYTMCMLSGIATTAN